MEPFFKFIAFTMHTLPEVQRIPFLEQVSTALVKRSVNTGSIDDLDRAIFMKECKWERTENEHPNYLIYVESFCYALSERYDKTKSLDDLNRAITLENILLTPSLAPEDRIVRLNNLRKALYERFNRNDSLNDLDQAILIMDEMVAAAPSDDDSLLLIQFANAGRHALPETDQRTISTALLLSVNKRLYSMILRQQCIWTL